MGARNGGDDRQAETDPPGGACSRGICPVERLEYELAFLGWDARSVIGDLHADRGWFGVQADLYRGAWWGVLDGVPEQVVYRLSEAVGVAYHRRGTW